MEKKIIITSLIFIITISIILNYTSRLKNKKINIKNAEVNSGTTFDWSPLQVVDDMDIGINLSFALDRRDGLNRSIDYFENDPYVIKGKRTKEEAYLLYYQTLDLSNLQLLNEDMIKKVKAAGFNAIRLPVTWMDHLYYIDENREKIKNFNPYDFGYPDDLEKQKEIISKLKIEEVWIERVKEVIGWILDNDMYCIINVHGDVGQEKIFNVKQNLFDNDEAAVDTRIKSWIYVADSKVNSVDENGNIIYTNEPRMDKYKLALGKLWTEIGDNFKDFGPKLLFEGFNEIRVERCPLDKDGNQDCVNYFLGEGQRADTNVTKKELEWLNELNDVFVNAVRNTGGNNSKRFLVVNTYLAELSVGSLEYFTIPNDSVNHIIMAAHFYDHFSSCNDDYDEYYKCIMNNGTDCETTNNYCTPSEISVPGNVAIVTDENNESESIKKPSTYYKLSLISKKAKELNVPIIIGEFSTYLDESSKYHLDKKRSVESHNYYLRTAYHFGTELGNYLSVNNNLNGIACFYWDDATTRFKLLNERRPRASDLDKPTWMYPKMVEAMMKGKEGLTILLNDDPYDMSVSAETFNIDTKISNLRIGQSEQLSISFYPSYSDKNTQITWESSNSNIVAVDESGTIIGISPGEAVITASNENNLTKQLNVKVYDNNKLQIKFYSNTPIEEVSTQALDINQAANLIENNYTKQGYQFLKWNTKKDGTGESYENAQEITINEDLILYAQWKEIIPYMINNYNAINNSTYIDKIEVNTIVNNFTSNFTLGYGYGIDVDYKTINNKDVLYTGSQTRITKGLDTYKTFTNIVSGDTNGDGKINYLDYVNVYNHIQKSKYPELNKNLLENEYYIAGDMTNDNKINYLDYVKIYNKIKELKGEN